MSLQVVIIGAVALGPKAGCRIKRLDPSVNVTMLDRDSLISYGGCGIPYFVSGDVADLKGLLSTSFHMERNAGFFKGAKGIEVLTRTEAVAIDRKTKQVRIANLDHGGEKSIPYDRLIIATGSSPVVPPVPGMDLEGVMPINDLHAAQRVQEMVSQGRVESAVVIGAGATGLEMAEALADLWGVETHVVEAADRILPAFMDREMASMMTSHLEAQDEVNIHLNCPVSRILDDGQGKVRGVVAGGEEIACDLVLVATGVRPNSELAREAGLELDDRGAIVVDEYLRTSDPDIFAGGDCVSQMHLISGQRIYMPSGSVANRMGRVIGGNVLGGQNRFPGVVGTFCIKLFGLSLAHIGLNEDQARAAGFDPAAPLVVQADRAHFHPDQAMMYMKMVADRSSRRVLGLTALGENGDAVVARVNALAASIGGGVSLDEISNLEMAYSPPLGAALDILNAAANTVENLIEGRLNSMHMDEFTRRLEQGEGADTVFMDMRTAENAKPFLERYAPAWTHLPQETLAQHLNEVPRDKDVVLVCNSGARSYEAQCTLNAAGFSNTYNLGGGVAAVRKSGYPILGNGDKSGK